MLNQRTIPVFGTSLLLAVSAWGQTVATGAFYTSLSILPPVGLALTETAQVNMVNSALVPASGTAPSCTGSVAFYKCKRIYHRYRNQLHSGCRADCFRHVAIRLDGSYRLTYCRSG